MTLTLTIADNTAGTRLLNGFCLGSNYDPGSGITKADWVRQQLALFLKQTAKRGEVRADSAAISTAIDAIAVT